MKLRQRLPGLLALSAVVYLTNCMGSSSAPPAAATISISPQPASVAAGASVNFTATTTNASTFTPSWAIDNNASIGTIAGTLNTTNGSTVTYTAPSTPPVYNFESGSTDGMVMVDAGVENTAGCDDVTATASFIITAPAVTAGLTPATMSVALGSTQAFHGYAIGNVNMGVTVQVNGVTGGSTSTGTIAATQGFADAYTYTAPATMPMSGATITLTLISQADPTKTATAVVTLH